MFKNYFSQTTRKVSLKRDIIQETPVNINNNKAENNQINLQMDFQSVDDNENAYDDEEKTLNPDKAFDFKVPKYFIMNLQELLIKEEDRRNQSQLAANTFLESVRDPWMFLLMIESVIHYYH